MVAWVGETRFSRSVRSVRDALKAYGCAEVAEMRPATLGSFLRENGIIVGGACGEIFGNRLVLDLLWVSEEFRNRGIGTRLLRATEEMAAEQGCRDVILETLNARAVQYYVREGYEVATRVENFIPGFDKVILTRRIA